MSSSRLLYSIEILLIVLSMIIALIICVAPQSAQIMIDVSLFIYIAIIYVNFKRSKSFNIYQVWIVGYIFIVWAEMCIICDSREYLGGYITPFCRFILANACVLLGYNIRQKEMPPSIYKIRKDNAWFPLLIAVLSAYFIYQKMPSVMNVYNEGRGTILSNAKGSGTLMGALRGALGLLMPAMIAYYIRRVKKKPVALALVLSLPITILQLFGGTRFRFLFSVLPIMIILGLFNIKRGEKNKIALLVMAMVAMILLTNFVKENRASGFADAEMSFFDENERYESKRATVWLARHFSPEGIVRMARRADVYFSENSLHYGKETSFILYFWVPRSIWKDKPTQLDYWLIREFENVADEFSTASGFIGELRADFGWGCLFFIFLFGMLLKKIDLYSTAVLSKENDAFNVVLVSVLYPWAFFFVRSPITSTMSLLWQLAIFYAFKYMFATNRKELGN